MKVTSFYLAALAMAFALVPSAVSAAPSTSKPNVVYILGDDIGYGDFGCYGATKIKTPNVDKVATQGVRFTDAHSPAAVCTPTRYALMTGQYAFRNPLGSHILPGDAPLSIKPGVFTVPELFRRHGYKTAAVGKWHIGLGEAKNGKFDGPDWNGEIKPGPLEVGFNQCFIIPATGDRAPCVFVEDHHVFGWDPKDPIKVDYTNCKWGHANQIQGIGRIGAMTGGKAALWKDEQIAETLTARAVKFIEENKAQPFFLYLATHDIHVPRVPAAQFRGKSKAGVRGDAVQEFDWTVGQVVETLDRLKLADNTWLIIASDNGGVLDHGDSIQRDGDEVSNNGHAFNGALRGTKGSPWEGGTRVPLIMRWPGKLAPGVSDQLICLVDSLATFTTMLGDRLPKEAGPDSFDFYSTLLSGKSDKPVRDHLVEQARRMAIRQGQWKYIVSATGRAKKADEEKAELYNLASDLSERHNLAEKNPEKAKELAELLKRVREEKRTRPE